ncbi:MAG TPA: amidohydrolase, partial [Chitinophagaceae bacterium]
MKKIFLSFIICGIGLVAGAQSNVLPAEKQKTPIVITNATIHTGTGEVLENASIVIVDGKITAVGKNVSVPPGAEMVDAKGKQVYPGIILPVSSLGLIETGTVKASNDVREIGDMNPNVRSIVAYN